MGNAHAGTPSVSVIVPTYKEALNLPVLIERVEAVRDSGHLDLEMLIMDDDSRDGTEEAVASMNRDWVRLIVRTSDRGLSAAVLDGFRQARHEIFLVMDADLSHPPETIPEMLHRLCSGADFVLGSRYVKGGSTEEAWGFLRWINSKVATLLARPFTRLKDPMSGFFAFHRSLLDNAPPMNPVGYKIGLEVLVKCNCRNAVEIPIYFHQRFRGESKLSLREQLLYLEHLRRLAEYKYGDWARFMEFSFVGFSGTFVNLAVLTLLVWLGMPVRAAVAVAIFSAMFTNFLLNRQFTFSYARDRHWAGQLLGFVGASSLGALVNYIVTLSVLHYWPFTERFPQIAALFGIVAGLASNYLLSRYIVFKKPAPADYPASRERN
ncbi:MAG: glycosyltransferase family 2 protein [Candidatus Hydrogenedentes bacterium]|nr:glycosyltransferase family 2 protein [Candidatus Hydrogenedentota bacterium]